MEIESAITYKYTPEINCDEQAKIEIAMHREDKHKEVVRDGLRVAVDGVECMRGEGCGDYPFVVRFMDMLVHEWNMQPSMNPVDAVVCEHKETVGESADRMEMSWEALMS
jgi:hypothetical protein